MLVLPRNSGMPLRSRFVWIRKGPSTDIPPRWGRPSFAVPTMITKQHFRARRFYCFSLNQQPIKLYCSVHWKCYKMWRVFIVVVLLCFVTRVRFTVYNLTILQEMIPALLVGHHRPDPWIAREASARWNFRSLWAPQIRYTHQRHFTFLFGLAHWSIVYLYPVVQASDMRMSMRLHIQENFGNLQMSRFVRYLHYISICAWWGIFSM